MAIPKVVSQNPVASFAVGTLGIQLAILLTCLILRSLTIPGSSAITASNSVVALPQAEPLGEPVVVEPAPQAPAEPLEAADVGRTVVHTVKAGENFTKIWAAYGGTASGAIRAEKSLKSLGTAIPGIRQGEKITLTLSDDDDIVRLQRRLRDGRALTIEGNSKDGYRASIGSQSAQENERIASGIISRSFAAAAEEQDIPYSVVNELVDLFGGRIEFARQVQRGDSFSVMYSERRTDDGEFLASTVQAASLKVSGKSYVAVRHVSRDGSVRYFDESGEPLGNFFLRYPVQFTRISSVFSTARFHPVLKRTRPHNGVDFAAPIGTPVRAVADGIIASSGYFGDAGKMVKIKHGDRYSTAYLHLSRIDKSIRSGVRVKRGQVIGAVGMTGLASGPHLHFSLFDRGKYVNPMAIDLPRMPIQEEAIPVEYLRATLLKLASHRSDVQLALAADVDSPKA